MSTEYDEVRFFNEYARMDRSQKGLAGAGEWPMLKPLFPSLVGKSALDLGCGYGWHCKYMADCGAERILGIDGSERMIAEAERRNAGPNIEYRLASIEDYEYPENAWDFVFSNLALHYVRDIEGIYKKVYRSLKADGIFLFNIEHPTFTAGIGEEWIYDENGKALYWPVDNYFYSGERKTRFLGCEVKKEHHTLTEILMGLLANGFVLEAVQEAKPMGEMLLLPGMKDELRRPMMLLVKARVKK